MRSLRPTLARGAFLGLLLAVGTAEMCDADGRRCVTDYDCGGGAVYSCQSIESERICLPTDPAQYAAVVGAYLNKKAAVCAAEGHDFGSKVVSARYPVPGMPGCEQVIKQKVCKRCRSNITVRIDYEGDCGGLEGKDCG